MGREPAHISRYISYLECPNSICTKIGLDGQKGWIYKTYKKTKSKQDYFCQCYFCGVTFNPNAISPQTWMGSKEQKSLPFNFDDDIWYLKHFYAKPHNKTFNFKSIEPHWYKDKVKQYIYYLCKSQIYSSDSSILSIVCSLRKFGEIIKQQNLDDIENINRKTRVHPNCAISIKAQ